MGERDYFKSEFEPRGWRPRGAFWAAWPGTKLLLIGLVAIHLLVSVISRADPGTGTALRRILALWPGLVLQKFHIWQLVTAALLHAPGLWHLAVNCLMIFFFGRMVEERLNLRRFGLFCLAATVGSSLAYLLESVLLNQAFPMVGASGLAIGVTVLAACWFPNRTILLFFILPMPLWVAAVIFVVADLIMLLDMPGGVAHSAHLGGALYAWIYFRYGGGVERVFDAIDSFADKQRQKKQQKTRAEEAELRREVDRILDKVNREGMTALTDEERRFLKQASDKLRR